MKKVTIALLALLTLGGCGPSEELEECMGQTYDTEFVEDGDYVWDIAIREYEEKHGEIDFSLINETEEKEFIEIVLKHVESYRISLPLEEKVERVKKVEKLCHSQGIY
tara:strand:- start:96 stop:419 length:324 start_codon:yes stop_codon:yes gene_type:complete